MSFSNLISGGEGGLLPSGAPSDSSFGDKLKTYAGDHFPVMGGLMGIPQAPQAPDAPQVPIAGMPPSSGLSTLLKLFM